VKSIRIASPERKMRVVATPLAFGIIGWALAASIHLGIRPAESPGLGLEVKVIITTAAVAIGSWLGQRILRTHLIVSDDGITDVRIFTSVNISWNEASEFDIGRPGGLHGGLCVIVTRPDGATIDLLSTRAYSIIPSARHVDELHRIVWTLQESAETRGSVL
jgi:hypothetical protein